MQEKLKQLVAIGAAELVHEDTVKLPTGRTAADGKPITNDEKHQWFNVTTADPAKLKQAKPMRVGIWRATAGAKHGGAHFCGTVKQLQALMQALGGKKK